MNFWDFVDGHEWFCGIVVFLFLATIVRVVLALTHTGVCQ